MPIRSFLYEIFIYIWGIIIPIIYSKAFFKKDSRVADDGALVWARFNAFVLRKICKIEYEVRGLENLPKNTGYIVACQHQSMWETFIMHLIFHHPVYAYKKELLKVPFYGWFVRRMSGIAIDRNGGGKALKDLLKSSQKYIDAGRVIVIFPQGTRVPVSKSYKEYPYQPGIVALYSQLKCPIIPAALNSGKFYPKDMLGKKPGKIILEFLPAIDPNTDKKEFLKVLEEQIEAKSKQLL